MFQATRMIRFATSARTTIVRTTTRAASLSTTSVIRQLESTTSTAPSDTITPPPSSTSANPESFSSSSNPTEFSEPKAKSKPTWTRRSLKPSTTTPTPTELPSYPALHALEAFSPIPVLPSSTHCATLTLRSYTPSLHHLTFYTQFVLRSARALGLRTSGSHPLPLKTQLITVPRSPFAHKKSQQNFWRKTHSRRVEVYDANEEVLEMWLGYLRKEGMGGVGVKVQSFKKRELGWASGVKGEGRKIGQEGMDEELEVERLAKELEGEIKLGLEQEQEQEQEEQVEVESEQTEVKVEEEEGKREETN